MVSENVATPLHSLEAATMAFLQEKEAIKGQLLAHWDLRLEIELVHCNALQELYVQNIQVLQEQDTRSRLISLCLCLPRLPC